MGSFNMKTICNIASFAIEAMGELVPRLAGARRVIGVELQGHGHTTDIERPLRFASMAAENVRSLPLHAQFLTRPRRTLPVPALSASVITSWYVPDLFV